MSKFSRIQTVKVIHWSLAQVNYAYSQKGYGNCSCETKMNPKAFLEEFQSGEFQKKNLDTVFAGAWVLDKEEIVKQDQRLVYRAPVLDVNLPKQTIQSLGRTISNATINMLSFSWENVSVDLYVEWWRIHGAKVGKVQKDGKTIIWEPIYKEQMNLF